MNIMDKYTIKEMAEIAKELRESEIDKISFNYESRDFISILKHSFYNNLAK
jgi:hypothetical protein